MATRTSKRTVTAKAPTMFTKTIETMIRSSMSKGHDSRKIAEKLNNSAIAKKQGLTFNYRSIATKMGNISRTSH